MTPAPTGRVLGCLARVQGTIGCWYRSRRIYRERHAIRSISPIPWTGEARRIWKELMRGAVNLGGIDSAACDATIVRWRTARWAALGAGGCSDALSSAVQQHTDTTIRTTTLDLWIDVILSKTPMQVEQHIAVLVSQWPVDSYPLHRIEAISHPNYPAEMLHRLVNDAVPEVRQAVAGHPNCCLETLTILWGDSDAHIRYVACQHPRTPDYIRVIVVLGR